MAIPNTLDTPDTLDTPGTPRSGDARGAAPRKQLRGAANPRSPAPRSSRGAWPLPRPAPRAFPCCPAGARTMSGARAAGWRRAVQRRSRESTVSGPHLSREPYRLRLLPVLIPRPSRRAGRAVPVSGGSDADSLAIPEPSGAAAAGHVSRRAAGGRALASAARRARGSRSRLSPSLSLPQSRRPSVRPSPFPAAGAAPSGRRRRRRVPFPPARR